MSNTVIDYERRNSQDGGVVEWLDCAVTFKALWPSQILGIARFQSQVFEQPLSRRRFKLHTQPGSLTHPTFTFEATSRPTK